MFDHGHLEAGQTVLILGAGGALGSVAVQLARSADAYVIGTGRSNVKSAVLEVGADRFVDLEQDRWWDTVGPVDVVYDTVGGDILARSEALVKPGGALVTVMFPPAEVGPDIRTVHFIREPGRAQLKKLAELIDDGKLRVPVGAVYPLSETQTAFADQASRKVRGKVILQP